jgi:hypothetical protein
MNASRSTNNALAGYLTQAGWTPRALAREINRLFGRGTVAETAPYYWRDDGGVPHTPLPAMAAYVLSQRLGTPITVGELWQGRAVESPMLVPATDGMCTAWSIANTRVIVDDWLRGGLMDRRQFLGASGEALAGAVWLYLSANNVLAGELANAAGESTDPLLEQIEQTIPMLQRLDDAKGGAASLSYVGAQVRAVGLVLHEDSHGSAVTRRLLMALADLAQLAGWMAFDAGRQGLAQRYFFTGLRAAHDAGYRAMSAHILADLAFQAASCGQARDGVRLGEAAARAGAKSTATVRATVLNRLAYAYASAGQTADFARTRYAALDMLTHRGTHEPPWMYYLTPNHLDCQAGYSLILMGRQRLAGGDSIGKTMLRDGTELLRGGAHDVSLDDASQRRALFEGAWLALGYASSGRLDEASDVGVRAMSRLERVHSPRSVAVLEQVAATLRRRSRNAQAAEFLPVLERALSRHPS